MKRRTKARAGKGSRKAGKAAKASRRKVRKTNMRTVSRSVKAKHKPVKPVRRPRQQEQPAQAAMQPHRAAEEVPTLEQVTITCANCGRPFKLFKLKGLSLEGTICQRCSLGEMELPESFG